MSLKTGKYPLNKLTLLVVLMLGAYASIVAALPSHLDPSKNISGCSACHSGHGKRGTQMLKVDKKDFCFSCHGSSARTGGGNARTDMLSVFNKRSKHPVLETSDYHSAKEELPERNSAMPRHVACEDCHKTHEGEPGNTLKGAKGHNKGIWDKDEASAEYEVCYRCHSDSANLRSDSKNKADEFDLNNASFHPIEGAGKNVRVPSLQSPYDVGSIINCSDCHGNNDVFGPKGPHGSDYDFMLVKEYMTTESSESQNAYDLCYSCHNRQSILRNESFQKHNEHIVYYHAPCIACHVSHGSRTNKHLLDLSRFAAPTSLPSYVASNTGRPNCYLTCHIGNKYVVHDSAFYSAKKWP